MPEQVTHQTTGGDWQCDHCRKVYRYRDQAADCERYHQYAARRDARRDGTR